MITADVHVNPGIPITGKCRLDWTGVFGIVLTIQLREKCCLQTQARLKLLTTLSERPSLGTTMASSKAKERLNYPNYRDSIAIVKSTIDSRDSTFDYR